MLEFVSKAARGLSVACGALAALGVAAAVAIVCQMVLFRYGLGASTYWQTECITFLVLGSTFLGCPYVALTRGHVRVDALVRALGARPRAALELAAALIALAFAALVAFKGAELWLEAWRGGWRSESVWRLPLWIPYLSVPVGMGAMALQYAADALLLCRELWRGAASAQPGGS